LAEKKGRGKAGFGETLTALMKFLTQKNRERKIFQSAAQGMVVALNESSQNLDIQI
jgi:hypothetical protein